MLVGTKAFKTIWVPLIVLQLWALSLFAQSSTSGTYELPDGYEYVTEVVVESPDGDTVYIIEEVENESAASHPQRSIQGQRQMLQEERGGGSEHAQDLSESIPQAPQVMQTQVQHPTWRLSISETNDAAVLGLQESITPDSLRPNDIGYTHGIKIEFENVDSSLFGMSGTMQFRLVSDLITEYNSAGNSSIFSIDQDDEPPITAIDVYRMGIKFEQHAKTSGLKFILGTEIEYMTNTNSFDSSLSFISGSSRQAAWHDYYNSVDYDYISGGVSRLSTNVFAGVGFEKGLGFGTIDLQTGALGKISKSSQARSESKLTADAKISFNDTVKNSRYFLSRGDRFIFSMGAKGEVGAGQKLEAYAGFDKNFSFSSSQFEISFFANLPVIQNFFDYKDFTTPRVFNTESPGDGGILDYEPVYTIQLSLLW